MHKANNNMADNDGDLIELTVDEESKNEAGILKNMARRGIYSNQKMPPSFYGRFLDFLQAQMGGYWNQISESRQRSTVRGAIRI